MKLNKFLFVSISTTLLNFPLSSNAAIDSGAAVIELRQSCTENGSIHDNCFESYKDVNFWIKNTRKPNINSPLRVDIGPGVFEGFDHPEYGKMNINIFCNSANGYTGYTTYKGSGSDQTILKGNGSHSSASVNIKNCTELQFSDLKVETNFYGGIYWSGGGNSVWSNVHVDTVARAWAEPSCGNTKGKHYWFSSRLKSTSAFSVGVTYEATCDETWFYGSEVSIVSNGGANANTSTSAVHANGSGIIHLYGSNLRAFIDDASPNYAASAINAGHIHIHGTGIDAISDTGKNVTALYVENGGVIHADASAYVLKTSGAKTRVLNNGGHVSAQHQWGQASEPTAIISENGADLAVETDCNATGCSNTPSIEDTQTHLLIYNDNCPLENESDGGPWFNIVTGKCRGAQ